METSRLNTQRNVPLFEESVVDFWESIPRDWPQHKYDVALVEDLDRLLRDYGRKQGFPIKRVLDCGCGTGNPAIGLAKKGYEMFCVDSDPNMVERFKVNCRDANVELPVITYDWRDLNGDLQKQGPFDAAICRGNSLIYAGCWERPSFIAQAAAKAIATSLKHISDVLRAGGLFYVDITSRKEYADLTRNVEFIGIRDTSTHNVMIYWINDYDSRKKMRRVYARRLFESKETSELTEVRTHTFTGYLLTHDELKKLSHETSLEVFEEYAPIKSEPFYDVFLFEKVGWVKKS